MKRRSLGLNIIKDKSRIDMTAIKLKGNILDVGIRNYGIIYKLCKQNEDEVAVEYVMDEEREFISDKCYDSVVLFFSLGQLNNSKARRQLFREIDKYVSDAGEIFLWEVNKAVGEMLDLDIEVIMPSNEVQNIKLQYLNPMKKLSMNEIKSMVMHYFDIIDEKEESSFFYLRGKRKQKEKIIDESSVDCT